MDEDDYEEVEYDSSDDITDDNIYDTTVIPSSDVPDSIEFYKNYKEHSKQKMTDPCLTKYEKTKVLAERTQQVENGAVLYIPLTNKLTTAYSIASWISSNCDAVNIGLFTSAKSFLACSN